jgi:hypothetical protein
MVFNVSTVIIIVCIVLSIWSAILTFFVFRMIGHYNALINTTSKSTLKEALDTLLTGQRDIQGHQEALEKALVRVEHNTTFHLQRIGLVRFNPFSDTGGSQSFTFALLDGKDNGIVMTSLYARTGNRWYVKNVHNGKGVGIELSKEEQSAIIKAKHLTEEIK